MDKTRQLNYIDWALRFISLLITFIGLYWLNKWLNGSAIQLSSYGDETGKIIMKANASILLVLSGISLFLLGLPVHLKILKWISGFLAVFIFTFGAITLLEHLFNFDIGIDQIIAIEPKGVRATLSPNRMGFPASLSFTFLGAGFLFLVAERRKTATLMGLFVCILNLIPASGYLFNIGYFYSNARLTVIAWPTVLGLILSGIGLVFTRPGKVLKDMLVNDNPGDILIRRLLPAVILIPLMIGFIIINQERLIHYDPALSTGIEVVVMILAFSLMTFRIRNIVNRINASRRITENFLRESEKKYRLIFETANEGIWITDNKRKTLMVNQRLSEMLGYSISEILGRPTDDFICNDQEESRQEVIDKINIGKKTSGEFKLRRKDGTILWTISHVSPVLDEKGQLIRTVSMLTDITIRKKAENELQAAREKLNLALESGNIGIWEWDLITDKTVWDARMEKMFGIETGSFEGSHKAFVNLVHEEDVMHIEKAIFNTLNNGKAYANVYRTKPVNGMVKYITSRAIINKIENGKPVSLIGVCFDVTWMWEETEHTIIKLNEELLQSNKELENFAYIASHDLQEPLRMVSCFTQLLADQYESELDDKAREYINFAVEGANRMYELLNGLLAYSRIHTRGKNFSDVDTGQVVDIVIKNLSLKIRERNAILEIGKLPVVYADETQMIQLFQNLIANAIKFSSENPNILITSQLEKNEYCFSVKDHGLGIESQYFERIFNIFQRLHPREKYEGTGIGLAICKRIVDRHGGKIWLESIPEKGSTFYFTIPVKN
jgi:PAS domain S-box-containing protein